MVGSQRAPPERAVEPPTPEAFAKDPLLWREGRDPLIERLLTTRAQPTDSGSQPGDWVYSQRLNIDALQPALSGSLGAALQAAKNAEPPVEADDAPPRPDTEAEQPES